MDVPENLSAEEDGERQTDTLAVWIIEINVRMGKT